MFQVLKQEMLTMLMALAHRLCSGRSGRYRFERETGAQLVEYVLLVVLIIVIAMVAVKFFGQTTSTQYSNIVKSIDDVM